MKPVLLGGVELAMGQRCGDCDGSEIRREV